PASVRGSRLGYQSIGLASAEGGLESARSWRAIISSMQKRKFRIPRKKIAEFCKRWNITEFSLFGSVLRGDFRPDSDVDVLVSIDPNAHIGLFEIAEMMIELEEMFKRPVDLVEKEGLVNPYRRREILRTAQVVYAA
ncbi:MAG TPA: nucleotidyltransferase family protein, partial [Acidobacteriota bacterium]|nr:nucleotidyltransferase family protein [Acidobacteriota bacterium]